MRQPLHWMRWLLLLSLGIMLFLDGCSGPLAPCQGEGVGPLKDNFDNFQCKYNCECNNQHYLGVCINNKCKIFSERPTCGRASVSREILVRNRFFNQECPSITQQQRESCPSGAFDKVCRGEGLQTNRWSNCQCVGNTCPTKHVLCSKDCSPEKPCACIDLQSNTQHCGSCRNLCPRGAVCQQGQCICPKGTTRCKASCTTSPCPVVCVDLQQDSSHCGSCGKPCPQKGVCAQGVCQEVPIAAGSYQRGTPDEEMDWQFYKNFIGINRDRETVHYVVLTRPYLIGRNEVTRGWFKQLMGYDPSDWKCKGDVQRCPVHHVNLYQAMDFCNKLSQQQGVETCYTCDRHQGTPEVTCSAKPEFREKAIYQCKGYRLPTDAEWGFAVQAGTMGIFHETRPTKFPLDFANAYEEILAKIAWYAINAGGKLHQVATRKPNSWGIYDMLGNVSEWVWEIGSRYYPNDLVDPYGEHDDYEQTYRGGNITFPSLLVRNGFRGTEFPSLKDPTDSALSSYYGFRIARTSPFANETCSQLKLSSCGESGCKNTRINPEHCGVCGRKCPQFHICQRGQCVSPELEVPTHSKDGKPVIWERGYLMLPRPDSGQLYCYWDDALPHKVKFDYRFMMTRFEVRQRDYDALLGYNPSRFKTCPDCPVEGVNWYQALAYANALSRNKGYEECYECTGDIRKTDTFYCKLKEKFRGNKGRDYVTCKGYRLPTEAEWEFASLAGGKIKQHCKGTNWSDRANREAWHSHTANFRTHPVGTKPPNPLGLHDMLGNVAEWTWDVYLPYPVDPKNPDKVIVNPVGYRPTPTPQFCEKCSPTYRKDNTKCAPCFRTRRGSAYTYEPPATFDESYRGLFFHLTKLRNNPYGHLEVESVFGFRLARTLPSSIKSK